MGLFSKAKEVEKIKSLSLRVSQLEGDLLTSTDSRMSLHKTVKDLTQQNKDLRRELEIMDGSDINLEMVKIMVLLERKLSSKSFKTLGELQAGGWYR